MQRDTDRDEVYWAIKRKVLGTEFLPGKRILLAPVAEDLAVSVTRVRAAFARLALEGLVGRSGREFRAMHLGAYAAYGRYRVAGKLLSASLDEVIAAENTLERGSGVIEAILVELGRREPTPDAVATLTGKLFTDLARMRSGHKLRLAIQRSNRLLHRFRMLECRYLDDVTGELEGLCELALAGEYTELRRAVVEYHELRKARMPRIIDGLGQANPSGGLGGNAV